MENSTNKMKMMNLFSRNNGSKVNDNSDDSQKDAHQNLRDIARNNDLNSESSYPDDFDLDKNREQASTKFKKTLHSFIDGMTENEREMQEQERIKNSKLKQTNEDNKAGDSEQLKKIIERRNKALHKFDADKFKLSDLDEKTENIPSNKELIKDGGLRNGSNVIVGGMGLLTDNEAAAVIHEIDNSEFNEAGIDIVPDFSLFEDKSGFRPDSTTIPNHLAHSSAENTFYFLGDKSLDELNNNNSLLNFTKGDYTYYVNTDDNEERLNCLKTLSENTQRNFKWFFDLSDNNNWVIYDTDQFEETDENGNSVPYLHFKDGFIGNIDIPIGLKDCFKMFKDCDLTYANFNYHFNTENVISMKYMFEGAIYNSDYAFPALFTTSKVKSMTGMFKDSHFKNGIVFGDAFDTHNVNDMHYMFAGMKLDETFKFSDNFDTSNVTQMRGMFKDALIYGGFNLFEILNTENCLDMGYMFYNVKFPKKFRFGKKFVTLAVQDMSYMFSRAVLPTMNNLISDFHTQNVLDFSCMFSRAELPECFTIPVTFITKNAEFMEKMFYGCTLGENFVLPETFTSDNLINVTHMFAGATLDKSFALPLNFKPDIVKNNYEIFGNCKGLGLGVNLQSLEKIVTKLHMKYVEFYVN